MNINYRLYKLLERRKQILMVICLLFFAQIFLKKLDFEDIFPLFSFVDEALTLLAIFYLLKKGDLLQRQKKLFNKFLFYFSLFILLGFVSSLKNSVLYNSSLLQIFLDLKFFAIILALNIFCRNIPVKDWLLPAIKTFLIANIPLILLQYFNIQLYEQLFDVEGIAGKITLAGNTIERAVGCFWHPSQLAIFCCFSFYIFLKLGSNKKWVILSLIQLILTFQRQEIATVLFSVSIIYLADIKWSNYAKYKILLLLFPVCLLIAALIFVSLFNESFQTYTQANSINDIEDVRFIFYIKSFVVAFQNMPLGSGFGTFGGYAAFLYDSPLYRSLGFGDYYWYESGIYMTDTYYPHIIAETGFIGAIFYLLAVIACYRFIIKTTNSKSIKMAYQFSFLMVFIGSITAPMINDQLTVFLSSILPFIFQVRSFIKIKNQQKTSLVQPI